MRVTVDTNVLIRLVTRDSPREAEVAAEFLRSAERIAVSTVAICEMVWVLGRQYHYSRERIASAIEVLRNTGNLVLDEPAVDAGLTFLRRSGDFADAVIALEGGRLGGTTFVSFDKQATRLVEALHGEAQLLS